MLASTPPTMLSAAPFSHAVHVFNLYRALGSAFPQVAVFFFFFNLRFRVLHVRPSNPTTAWVPPPTCPNLCRCHDAYSYANLPISSFGGDECKMMDPAPVRPHSDERNRRFKLIPRVIGGPWMVRKAVGSTPVLLGTKIGHRCVFIGSPCTHLIPFH